MYKQPLTSGITVLDYWTFCFIRALNKYIIIHFTQTYSNLSIHIHMKQTLNRHTQKLDSLRFLNRNNLDNIIHILYIGSLWEKMYTNLPYNDLKI